VAALNHYRIWVSYNTVKRIIANLAELIITTAGDNRVPLPAVFETTRQLNGAMDNFDCNKSILAEKGFTKDTILFSFKIFPVV